MCIVYILSLIVKVPTIDDGFDGANTTKGALEPRAYICARRLWCMELWLWSILPMKS